MRSLSIRASAVVRTAAVVIGFSLSSIAWGQTAQQLAAAIQQQQLQIQALQAQTQALLAQNVVLQNALTAQGNTLAGHTNALAAQNNALAVLQASDAAQTASITQLQQGNFAGNVTIGGALSVTGNATIAGNLGVKVANPMQPLAVNGVIAGDGSLLTNIAGVVPDGSITSAKLADGAVTNAKVANGLDGAKIVGTVPDAASLGGTTAANYLTIAFKNQLANVGTINGVANPIDWSQLKNVPANVLNAITNVADGSITTAKLANGAVTDAKVGNGIDGAKIAGAVTNSLNLGGAPSGDYLTKTGDGSGLTNVIATIADGSITTAKLADGAVTSAKVASIAGSKITGSVAAADFATDAAHSTNADSASTLNGKAASEFLLATANVAFLDKNQTFTGANTFSSTANSMNGVSVGTISGNGSGLSSVTVAWSSVTGIPASLQDGDQIGYSTVAELRAVLDTVYLPLSGGTLTGPLTLAGPPTAANQATTKSFVDAADANIQATLSFIQSSMITNAGSGLAKTGNTLSFAPTGTSGQVLTWNGSSWVGQTLSLPFLPLSGGTLTGPLSVSGSISSSDYIKPGNSTGPADFSNLGAIRYAAGNLQYNSGAGWTSICPLDISNKVSNSLLQTNLAVSGNLTVAGSQGVSGLATFSSTAGVVVSVGTTAQRPASPTIGTLRFNTSTSKLEIFNGSAWINVPG